MKPRILAVAPVFFRIIPDEESSHYKNNKGKVDVFKIPSIRAGVFNIVYGSTDLKAHEELKDILLKDTYNININWNETFIVIPLVREIVELFDTNEFELTFVYPTFRSKFYQFVQRSQTLMQYSLSHFKDFDQEIANSISYCMNMWEVWDVFYQSLKDLYKGKIIEVQIGESIENYYHENIHDFLSHPTPREVEVTHGDYYKYGSLEPKAPDSDNLVEWVNWMNKILQEIPEEYRDSAEFENQEDIVMVTYFRPETIEEIKTRQEEEIKNLNKAFAKYKAIQKLFRSDLMSPF